MTEKVEQLPISSASANTDEESATATHANDLRRKKRIKCAAYVAVFIVFQTIVLVTLQLTIMRVRTPKYRLNSVTVDNLSINNNATNSPSFNMRFAAEVTIKNSNFWPYKYNTNYMTFFYRGARVGDAIVTESSAKILSTKRLNLVLNVSSGAVLRSDIASGMVRLSCRAEMRGQVEVVKVLRKDRTARMDCTMAVNLADRVGQDLRCD